MSIEEFRWFSLKTLNLCCWSETSSLPIHNKFKLCRCVKTLHRKVMLWELKFKFCKDGGTFVCWGCLHRFYFWLEVEQALDQTYTATVQKLRKLKYLLDYWAGVKFELPQYVGDFSYSRICPFLRCSTVQYLLLAVSGYYRIFVVSDVSAWTRNLSSNIE